MMCVFPLSSSFFYLLSFLFLLIVLHNVSCCSYYSCSCCSFYEWSCSSFPVLLILVLLIVILLPYRIPAFVFKHFLSFSVVYLLVLLLFIPRATNSCSSYCCSASLSYACAAP